MSNLNDLLEKMKRCSFRIKIEEENSVWYWGTGFFISPQGYALTAYHNLPKAVIAAGKGAIEVFYQNLKDPISLNWLPDLSDKALDIAVLQLPDPSKVVFHPLTPAVISLDLPQEERLRGWQGREVLIFGFPIHGTGSADYLIKGTVSEDQPFRDVTEEYDENGNPTIIVRRLAIDAEDILPLEGISGGAVLAPEKKDWVIAVEGSYMRGDGLVFASELAQIVRKWPPELQREVRQLTDSPKLPRLKKRYFDWISDTYRELDFRGIAQVKNIVKLPLEEVYVPLSAAEKRPGPEEENGRQDRQAQMEERQRESRTPLAEVVSENPHLVVLGDPGAGKSTLLKYAALAQALGEGKKRLNIAGDWLPILFPISAYAEKLEKEPDLDLLGYLSHYFQGRGLPDLRPLFENALQKGQALVLLDGLDEVRDHHQRLQVVKRVESDFVKPHSGNRFIVTSRIAGYEHAPLSGEFTHCTVLPLNDEEVKQFAGQWCLAYKCSDGRERTPEAEHSAGEQAKALTAAVFSRPEIRRLAANPLLLTILALIHHQNVRLPHRRVDLYRLCVEALAETWNAARALSGRPIDLYLGQQRLDERFVVEVLGPVALCLHERLSGGAVERADLEKRLAAVLKARGQPQWDIHRLAGDFLDLMREGAGLLQEQGLGLYAFMHPTFEEYLAARALLESEFVDRLALLSERLFDPRWREVIRLAVGSAHARDANELLNCILETEGEGEQRGQNVVLAGECLLDRGGGRPDVMEALTALLEDPDVPVSTRASGGEVLGHLGDPRPGAGVDAQSGLPDICWLKVPAGAFLMGSNEYDDEKPIHEVNLSEFFISKYLLTNAQFGAFVEAGGYREEQWWTPQGWKWLQKQGITQPEYWDDPQWNGANYPAVGVSWYEAVAFCRWLTAQLRELAEPVEARGELDKTGEIRLPTEAEWEKAASWDWRKEKKYVYPWGDEFDDSKANTDEGGIGRTTPVGIYPEGASPCGALDMSGNVLEWCQDWYERDYYSQSPDRDPFGRSSGLGRVVRGGSWLNYPYYARAAYRRNHSPVYRLNYGGFRLARTF